MLVGYLVEMRELPAPHRARANVPHFTALNKIMQGLHRFFRRDFGVIPSNLEEIKVCGLQARERGLDRVEDGRAGESTLIDVLTLFLEVGLEMCADADIIRDEKRVLRRDYNLVTGNLILACDVENVEVFEGGKWYLFHELGH